MARQLTSCAGISALAAAICELGRSRSLHVGASEKVRILSDCGRCWALDLMGPDLAIDFLKFLGPRSWRSMAATCASAAAAVSDPRILAQLLRSVMPALCGNATSLLSHVAHNGSSAEGAFCLLACGSTKLLEERDPTHGRTPLMEATYYGAEPATVALLLQQRADPNARSNFGSTALLSACYMQELRSIKLLMEFRADPWLADCAGDNALHCAAYSGNSESVRIFLDAGVRIDIPNNSGWTALRYAYQERHTALVEELKQLGALECHGDRCAQ